MEGGEGERQHPPHTPVLYHEVLTALRPKSGGHYIDGTVGAGGHASGLLDLSAPDGLLLGLDRDPSALALASKRLERFGRRAILRHGSFAMLREQAGLLDWSQVDGILFDLGLSSMQLDDPARGFSFSGEGPLDMRFDPSQAMSAADLVNHLDETELARILGSYGEEPRARKIARAIVGARPLHTTGDLASVVARASGRGRSRIHPATRTFQALRMAVNDELQALVSGLEAALELLSAGGRLAVIAFHSLEDRAVKHFFRKEGRDCLCPDNQPLCTCEHLARIRVITPRPLRPGEEELSKNPRARSARLRVAERLASDQDSTGE